MVYKVIFKKRFQNKLQKLLSYIEMNLDYWLRRDLRSNSTRNSQYFNNNHLLVNHPSTSKTLEAFMQVNIICLIIKPKVIK